MMDDRPPVYEDGGLVIYRASALGGCKRMLALARQGYTAIAPPEHMLKVFEAGHKAEDQLWAKGVLSGLAQEYIELPITKRIMIVGHLDAWEIDAGAEAKSSSEAEYRKPWTESHMAQRWAYQISCYMHGTGKPFRLIRALRDRDGNVLEHREELLERAPIPLADIRARVLEVESMARSDLTSTECEKYEYPCPFFYTHLNKAEMREQCDDDGAVSLAVEYKRVQKEAEVLKGRVKVAREALLEWMGDKKKVDVGGWKLTKYVVKGKHVEYDAKDYEVLRVTEPKEEDNGPEPSTES